MNLSEIYEELLAGKKYIVSFPTHLNFLSFYSQLRTIKSRYEKKYASLSGESLSEGKVIRFLKDESSGNYEIFMGDRARKSNVVFNIIDIQDSQSKE